MSENHCDRIRQGPNAQLDAEDMAEYYDAVERREVICAAEARGFVAGLRWAADWVEREGDCPDMSSREARRIAADLRAEAARREGGT